MTRRIVTPFDISRMQALADRGLTQPQIAERTGWSLKTVERNVRTERGRLIGSFREVSATEADEMRRLASQGLSRTQIAVKVGRSWQTVSRHVGDIVPARAGRAPDVARYRRMLKAVAGAEYGSRDEIARRFGLKDRFSLKTTLAIARRAVALEEAVRREAAARGEAA